MEFVLDVSMACDPLQLIPFDSLYIHPLLPMACALDISKASNPSKLVPFQFIHIEPL